MLKIGVYGYFGIRGEGKVCKWVYMGVENWSIWMFDVNGEGKCGMGYIWVFEIG